MKSYEAMEEEALAVRRDIIEMLYQAGSGHPGGSLSVTCGCSASGLRGPGPGGTQ